MACLLRGTLLVTLVCISLAVPIGIIAWTWHSVFGDQPDATFANDCHIYDDKAVSDHELWYYSFPLYEAPHTIQIRRLNLETGEDLATSISLLAYRCQLVWLNDSLFIFSHQLGLDGKLHRWREETLTEVPLASLAPQSISAVPFVFDNQLTMLWEFEPSRFRLVHLDQDRWIDGNEIVIPTPDQFASLNAEADRSYIEMLLSSGQMRLHFQFHTRKLGVQPRLLQLDVATAYNVYRDQFQFIDPPGDVASAIRPENAPTLLWNWYAYDADGHGGYLRDLMQVADDELLYCEGRQLLQRRTGDEMQAVPAAIDPFGSYTQGNTHLLTNPDGSREYVLIEDGTRLQCVNIHRVQGDTIFPAHVRLTGVVNEYLSRWMRLLVGMFGAGMVHVMILDLGLEWFLHERPIHRGDLPRLRFASTTRRAFALSVDATIVLVVLIPIYRCGVVWPERDNYAQCGLLRGIKYSIGAVFNTFGRGTEFIWHNLGPELISLIEKIGSFFSTTCPDPGESPLSFVAILMLFCLLMFLRCRIESQFGVTPGKWLLGIRTVRTDQRPCGFARSLLRTVLLSIDLFLFLTPLPALFSLLFSRKNQRLGDRLADTMVVVCKSTTVG